MDFCADFPLLEPAQQERFKEVVTRLLSGDIVTPGGGLRLDPDWVFAERQRQLIDAYLRLGGWRLDIDLGLRICRAIHESGKQRVRLSKFESLVVCLLRLVHHEQMKQVREDERCELAVGDLRERLVQAGKPSGQVTRRVLEVAVRRLAKHGLVDIDRGFSAEDAEMVRINPVIERVLPPDRIADLAARVKAYAGTTAAPSLEEAESTDETDEADENSP